VRLTPVAGARVGSVGVEVNYGGFAAAYGGDWSTRLRLSVLPQCALVTPAARECAGRPVMSRNDTGGRRVSGDVSLAGGPVLMLLSGGPSSDAGDYGATPLQASSTWVAGGSSGE